MQKIFQYPSELERSVKEAYSIPPFLMMENAAKSIVELILKLSDSNKKRVLIVCGKGNNGGDGYAVARMLLDKLEVFVYQAEPPKTEEALTQSQMYKLSGTMGTTFDVLKDYSKKADFIVDCIYGIGFHGELTSPAKEIIDVLNESKAVKIACDIPSGLYFKADYTITMGEQKLALYSDKAKECCGKIIVAELGIPRTQFEQYGDAAAFLVEESDMRLPFRKKRAAHKGTYGHTTIFAGEKSGAGIIAATAAMTFGSGLTTLLKTEHSNLEQFKINPELMISTTIPPKTTAVLIGSGLGPFTQNIKNEFLQWFDSAKNPGVVVDADLFGDESLVSFLKKLNSREDARIILTPHLSELVRLLKAVKKDFPSEIPDEWTNVELHTFDCTVRADVGKTLTSLFPHTTIIMKSANTFIASEKEIYIITDGCQSLAKGGSGDVLAGMTASLLAQGYSSKDAAITACEQHALASKKFGEDAYNLTPTSLIALI